PLLPLFSFNDPAPPRLYTLSLHDALPICILPIVAASEAEARDRQEYLQSLLPDRVGIDLLSSWSGIDLSVYPPDGPLPPLPDERSEEHTSELQSRSDLVCRLLLEKKKQNN